MKAQPPIVPTSTQSVVDSCGRKHIDTTPWNTRRLTDTGPSGFGEREREKRDQGTHCVDGGVGCVCGGGRGKQRTRSLRGVPLTTLSGDASLARAYFQALGTLITAIQRGAPCLQASSARKHRTQQFMSGNALPALSIAVPTAHI